MKVVLSRRSAVPVVRLALNVDGGYSADDPKKPASRGMTMQMITEGTTARNSLRIG